MDHRAELVDVIRGVRNRWRVRLALRGAVVVVAGTMLALLLSASGLESFRFSAPAIITFRIVSVGVFVGLLLYALVWPLRRRVTDAQVAMYLEERDPTLEAAIISAVEATANGGSDAHSPRLVEKLVERATEQCRAIDHGRGADRTSVQRHAATLAAIAATVALILAFGPAYLRHGLSALLVISRSAEASSPYSIQVQPGNAKVPRGADQPVHAKLLGFTSSDVSVMMRAEPGAPFTRVPLIASAQPGAFEGMLFHLEKATAKLPVKAPAIGESVIAYGQGPGAVLRKAEGVVTILDAPVKPICSKCTVQSAFTFEGNAGPGFSGGPVIDAGDGHLLGIVFGYVDDEPTKGHRTIYAYTMRRVFEELGTVEGKLPVDTD